MAYRLTVRGLEITCDTFDELQVAVGFYAGEVRDVGPAPQSLKPARAPTTQAASKKGAGPAKGWQFARWYAKREGREDVPKVRSELAKLKREDFTAYAKLEEVFLNEEGDD